jgi:hypothetical protein
MVIQFNNKVAVQVPRKRGVLKYILIICGILAILITLINIVLDGLTSIDFITGVFLPAFLIWRGTDYNYETIYNTVPTIVEIQNNIVTIAYREVRRHEDGKVVSEYYVFRKGDVSNFQYSVSLVALRLYGTPLVKIAGTSISEEDCRISHREQEVVLYAPKEKMKDLIDEIENCLEIKVELMDNI